MRFFLAGIMQGSHLALTLHHQGYRGQLRLLLERHFPAAEVYDPLSDHADSLSYDENRGRGVFFHHCDLCRQVDVVLAFVPEASMGTAIEMWEAHTHGRVVVTVSPLVHNWVVKFLSDVHYKDVEALEAELASGELAERIHAAQQAKANQQTKHPGKAFPGLD